MVMVVRRTTDVIPLMATDQKGKITHATSDLGKLLGYSKKQLCSMDLTDLLPPPFAQLHKPWVQVSVAESSCALSCMHVNHPTMPATSIFVMPHADVQLA